MRTVAASASTPHQDHAACSGCSLCLLVCPVWRHSRDLDLTPHGRAKALQHGVAAADITVSIESCTLCGACRPACPEEIDPVEMLLQLRREVVHPALPSLPSSTVRSSAAQNISARIFLPDTGLRTHPDILAKIVVLLGSAGDVSAAASGTDGSDIALALEAGALIAQRRLEQFLEPLRGKKEIVVADGLLFHYLKRWLPEINFITLGEALSSRAGIRGNLRATDLYVIEPRAYHADYQRLVKYYDRLRRERGCDLSLDLQRIAIPATAGSLVHRLGRLAPDDGAQISWLLQGRKMNRIVVENLEDYVALAAACTCPVVHLAELAEGEQHAHG